MSGWENNIKINSRGARLREGAVDLILPQALSKPGPLVLGYLVRVSVCVAREVEGVEEGERCNEGGEAREDCLAW